MQSLHEVRKFLLNLISAEQFSLVKELAYFDNPISLDPFLVSVLDLCVHESISCGMFHAVWVYLYSCEFFCNVRCVQQWWKVWSNAVYIKH